MMKSTSPLRLSAVLLALATPACAQNAANKSETPAPRQQTDADATPGPENGVTPGTPGASGGGGGNSRGGPSIPPGKPGSSPFGFQRTPSPIGVYRADAFARATSSDTPVIITTKATDRTAQSEWTEDLKVMDRLIGVATGAPGYGTPGRQVLGIKILMLGHEAPMYIEGCGVILRGVVDVPLAGGKATTKPDGKTRDPQSEWEQTRRQIAGGGGGGKRNDYDPNLPGEPESLPPAFQQEQLDALIAGIIAKLPQASNIRHLAADEFVIVSLAGIDDVGTPMRLTLKARKSDIDAAAAGKLKPDEFKSKVSLRIG